MILSFDTPKKTRSTEEHNKAHTSDSGIPGTYVPNMSNTDAERWKAKHIKGDNERIEIRKSFPMAQIVIVVRKHPPLPYPEYGTDYKKWSPEDDERVEVLRVKWNEAKNNIKVSMNGSLWLSFQDYREMEQAIAEACGILNVPAF